MQKYKKISESQYTNMTLELSNNIFPVNGATVDVRKDTLDETLPDRSKKWRYIQSLLDKLRIVSKES